MIKTRTLNRYDFVSRSIGAIANHDHDWDLDIYFKVDQSVSKHLISYEIHRNLLFKVAAAVSDDLGYTVSRLGAKGEFRARPIALSVEEVSILPEDVMSGWRCVYPETTSLFDPCDDGDKIFRVVVTISQTHDDCPVYDYLSGISFKKEVADELMLYLCKVRGISYPYYKTYNVGRSDYLIPSLKAGRLPQRAEEPEAFGFHGLEGSLPLGLTNLKSPWPEAAGSEGRYLMLKTQFTISSLSQVASGLALSEVLLENLISLSYQLGLLKADKGYPAWWLREIVSAETFVIKVIPANGGKVLTPRINVEIWLWQEPDVRLNQALRNKLRFFVDKDLRQTFGLTPFESKLPNPHMQALVNNVFLRRCETWND